MSDSRRAPENPEWVTPTLADQIRALAAEEPIKGLRRQFQAIADEVDELQRRADTLDGPYTYIVSVGGVTWKRVAG